MEGDLVPIMRVVGVLCKKRAGAGTAARISDPGACFDLNGALPVLPSPSLKKDGSPLLVLLFGS